MQVFPNSHEHIMCNMFLLGKSFSAGIKSLLQNATFSSNNILFKFVLVKRVLLFSFSSQKSLGTIHDHSLTSMSRLPHPHSKGCRQ